MSTLDQVLHTLDTLRAKAPGSSVEVRVVPYAAISCIAGVKHRRGTPPNVVEMSGETWLKLARGSLDYDTALEEGQIDASGTRAHELAQYLPLSADELGECLGGAYA